MKKSWQFINKSVRGASHIRKNAPCQDYSLCVAGEDGALPMLLAVSDGHGGSRYVRSAQGAVFACEAAIESAIGYAGGVFAEMGVNAIKQIAETRLKLDIIKKWRDAVLSHAENNPFSGDELRALGVSRARFEEQLGAADVSGMGDIFAAYGATLLLVIILERVIICEQLGDGDILFYYKNRSHKILSPIARDEGLLGNETTSLCSLKAPFYMRHSETYLFDRSNMPDLIMLATDGYANSFSDRDDYFKVLSDYYDILTTEGAGFVSDNIGEWLEETSREGSGDDITIAVAFRNIINNSPQKGS